MKGLGLQKAPPGCREAGACWGWSVSPGPAARGTTDILLESNPFKVFSASSCFFFSQTKAESEL